MIAAISRVIQRDTLYNVTTSADLTGGGTQSFTAVCAAGGSTYFRLDLTAVLSSRDLSIVACRGVAGTTGVVFGSGIASIDALVWGTTSAAGDNVVVHEAASN